MACGSPLGATEGGASAEPGLSQALPRVRGAGSRTLKTISVPPRPRRRAPLLQLRPVIGPRQASSAVALSSCRRLAGLRRTFSSTMLSTCGSSGGAGGAEDDRSGGPGPGRREEGCAPLPCTGPDGSFARTSLRGETSLGTFSSLKRICSFSNASRDLLQAPGRLLDQPLPPHPLESRSGRRHDGLIHRQAAARKHCLVPRVLSWSSTER
mmetsp:Transcript_64961/g.184299  ORF Transcript_64961/g.184299 Transcript_64961/m.184299 type:complete len:210 (-) Transcript_64961:321-950(-)